MGLNTSRAGQPYILAQSAVPVILAPNGTVATDGAVTLGTALPTTYSGGAWVRLPAGAVVGGLAGLYWTVFSSTTVGAVKTLFVDAATAFTPYIPSVALTAAVGSNAAYTQTTGADITLCNVTVPGGAMGVDGGIANTPVFYFLNSAGAKGIKIKLGASAGQTWTRTTTTNQMDTVTARNRGVSTAQVWQASAQTNGTASPATTSAIDTAIDQALTFTGQLAVATDYIVLEAVSIEVLPS